MCQAPVIGIILVQMGEDYEAPGEDGSSCSSSSVCLLPLLLLLPQAYFTVYLQYFYINLSFLTIL